MSSKPTIIMVPGSFAYPTAYESNASAIRAKGYEIETVALPTVGKKPGNPTMYDDAAQIAATATKYADQGKEVVLIAHSYSGVPTTESMKGLSKVNREKEGKKGGVVGLAYMTALVADVGQPAGATLVKDDGIPGPSAKPDEDGWLYIEDPEEAAKHVYNHISPEIGTAEVKKFGQHSGISFMNELTYAGYKDVPVSYLFCEDDLTVSPSNQRRAIDRIEAATGKKVAVTKVNSDHFPGLSAPEKTVDWMIGVAEKGGNW